MTISIPQKFQQLEDVLNIELQERRAEIRGGLTALVGGVHIFLLGPPGTAKSLLVNRLNAYIANSNRFEILMSRFSTPEEVFGPISLKGLENDEFVRKIDTYLPTVELAFLDEVFKANSSILNSLLMVINERRYVHGTSTITVPLATMFTASNELPQDESLAALYDRLLFRFEVKPIRDQSNFVRMMKTVRPDVPAPILDWTEVVQAQQEARQVVVPDSVIEAVAQLRRDLKEVGIEPTERRFMESVKVIRATAWLDETNVADLEHLQPLRHVLWNTPEQQAEVDKIILKIANPFANEARTLLGDIQGLEAQLDRIKGEPEAEQYRKGHEIHNKLKRAKKDLDGLTERAGNSGKRNESIGEVKDSLRRVTDRLLTEIFTYLGDDS